MTGMGSAVESSKLLAWFCLVGVTVLALPPKVACQDLPPTGSLLIATARMPDKDWAGAVVVIVYSDPQGVMGLILNRPTEFPLSHLFPEIRSTPAGKGPLYFGGWLR